MSETHASSTDGHGVRDDSIGVIAVVPDRWTDIVMPRHQVLRRLALRFPVAWVEPARNWREYLRPGGGHVLEPDRWFSPAPGLDVLTPGWRHPQIHRPAALGRAAFRSRLLAARQHLLDKGVKRVIVYVWRDELADAIDLVPHDLSCYHVDDEYSFDERESPNSLREVRLLQRVDQVIVHSPALMKKKGGINPNTVQIPNGVDYRSYASAAAMPPDLAAVPPPRIGYAGVIKKQLDLAQLARLARARPAYSFVMVGPVLNVTGKEQHIAELKGLPNVHFLGGKANAELPAYVQHFDVCLMCYEVNAYTNFIYPLKLNEYLASGRPTVSAPIDSVAGFGSVVSLARTDDDWIQALDHALTPAARSPQAVAERQTFARAHEWQTLVDKIAAHFRAGLARKSSALGVSAPVNH